MGEDGPYERRRRPHFFDQFDTPIRIQAWFFAGTCWIPHISRPLQRSSNFVSVGIDRISVFDTRERLQSVGLVGAMGWLSSLYNGHLLRTALFISRTPRTRNDGSSCINPTCNVDHQTIPIPAATKTE